MEEFRRSVAVSTESGGRTDTQVTTAYT